MSIGNHRINDLEEGIEEQEELEESEDMDENESSEESKEEKFIRLAEKRTNKALYAINRLSYLSNRINYLYTEDQVNEMFDALLFAIENAKEKFIGTSKGYKPFKFKPNR